MESEINLGEFSERVEFQTFNITLLPLNVNITREDIIQTINKLNEKEEVEFVSPVFNVDRIIATDEFNVKFIESATKEEIDAFNTANNVEVIREPQSLDWYHLRVKDPKTMNALRMANQYYENPITEYSTPNFIQRGWYASIKSEIYIGNYTKDLEYISSQKSGDIVFNDINRVSKVR